MSRTAYCAANCAPAFTAADSIERATTTGRPSLNSRETISSISAILANFAVFPPPENAGGRTPESAGARYGKLTPTCGRASANM